MKILSVIIPSYNSEAYMGKCIQSLLDSGNYIEIIIVNDGSIDCTGLIADKYRSKFPKRIKVIHQENAGHGGAIMAGLKEAEGKYIKVVDSDDWVDSSVMKKIVTVLKLLIDSNSEVDMLVSDFVYDKVNVINKKMMSYENLLPVDCRFTWEDIKDFPVNKYLLMHSVIFRRDLLIRSRLNLPNNTFYVDNLYLYIPLQYVETMYYMNECLYHYFIGRDDQSVNESNMLKRIEQQLSVNKIMIESVDLKKIASSKKRKYMLQYLKIVTTVSSVFLTKIGSKEAIAKKKELWKMIRKNNYMLHNQLQSSLLECILKIPGKMGQKLTLYLYEKTRKHVGFN